MITNAIILIFLLLSSAFFSCAETSITLTRAEKLSDKISLSILKNRERLVNAMLTGNTLVNVLLSAIATEIVISTIGNKGVLFSAPLVSIFVLIFAEILPKNYAIRRPEKTLENLLPIVVKVNICLAPFTNLLQGLSEKILRGLNIVDTEKAIYDKKYRNIAKSVLAEFGNISVRSFHIPIPNELKQKDFDFPEILENATIMEYILITNDNNVETAFIVNEDRERIGIISPKIIFSKIMNESREII